MAKFEDDELSRLVREKKGLPENWRVYLYESVEKGVRLTGALARPVTEYELREGERPGIDFRWIQPVVGKRTMTISLEQYHELVNKRIPADHPA